MSKLAIVFPGIGYTHEKPLLYFSRMIARDKGYDVICIEYKDLPENVKGDVAKMRQALQIAYDESCTALEDIDYSAYEDIVVVGKSLGTVVASKYCEEHCKDARLVLYTPVEATFRYRMNKAIAFIGDNDSWSDLNKVKELAGNASIPLHIYPECNHSLEVKGEYQKDIDILRSVMDITYDFIG